MLLVIEVGNTNTKIGVYEGPRLLVSWRLTTRREQTSDEYGLFIETLLRTRGLAPSDVRGAAISNVVPPVQQALEAMCEKYFAVNPLTVEPGVNTPITLNVDNPREVGPDRIVKAVAALTLYAPPLILIDFGTATTFDCINARGEFVGGAIAPGIATAADALLNRAARLFRVELVRPKDAIGRNTEQRAIGHRLWLGRPGRRPGGADEGRARRHAARGRHRRLRLADRERRPVDPGSER